MRLIPCALLPLLACATLGGAEPRPVYVPAAGLVPGVPAEPDRSAPPWIVDACPASWPVVDLNGTWKVSAHPDESCVDYQTVLHSYGPLRLNEVLKDGYAFPGWSDKPVPWPESFRPGPDGKPGEFRGVVYYHRTATLPAYDPAQQEPVLVFCGAGYRTDAWVAGRYLGQHLGQWARFEFPLADPARPDAVKPGASVPLLVKCVNTRFGQSYHGRLSVGIVEPVRIEIRPRRALRDLRTRITPDLGAVEACWTLPGLRGQARLTATVADAAGGAVLATVERQVDLAEPGFVRVPLAGARRWSPEDPFLHRLTLSLDGVEVGTRRFGWRTVGIGTDADGKQRLLLNGVPFWMRAFEFDYVWATVKEAQSLGFADPQRFGFNVHGRLREALKVLKFANVNTVRPHSMHHFQSETFYNLCDEEGILVNLDWNGGGPVQVERPKDNRKGLDDLGNVDAFERNRGAFAEFIAALHDHPALAFISFGNEMYDWAIPEGHTWDGLVTRYRDTLRRADWQGRPGSGSSGRPMWDCQAPTDFIDHHQYIGSYYGTWRDIVPYFRDTAEAIARRFGARLPFVTMETGDVSDVRVHGVNTRRARALVAKELPTREERGKLVQLLGLSDVHAAYLRFAPHNGGLRSYLTDLPTHRRQRGALMVKRYLELFRWQRELTDGVSLNTMFYSIAGRSDPDYNTLARKELEIQPWPDDGVLRLVDPIWDFREGFAPIQALMDVANPHPLCGAPAADEALVVVNDTLAAATVAVAATLRHADGRSVELGRIEGIAVPAGGKAERRLRVAVPADWPGGAATIELAVLRDGQPVAANHYDLQLLAAAERRREFPRKALALYEPAPAADGSTGAILDRLGIAYERIAAFERLERFQALVIGANQVDGTLLGAGQALNQWIQGGGRLLCFEQSSAGGIPWAADERVMKLARSTQMEVWFPRHPIFAGCAGYMQWTAPGGRGSAIFDTCLDLTDGFLAIATVGHFQDSSAVKAVVSDRRLGKGEYLLSMVTTLPRYGVDAVVTRYVENCLAYILGDAIAPEVVEAGDLAARTGAVMTLDNKDAFYINLRPAMNRDLVDEVAGDGLGGWTDHGKGADMRNLPRNFCRLDNLMPFWLVPPEKNEGKGCIVLKGPTREQFPEATAALTVEARLEKLYFLHTLMYVKAKEGEPVLAYEVGYADGTKAVVDLRNKVDIADWWMGKDLANAQVIFREGEKCLYCTQWVNPTPKVAISTLTVRSRGNAIPIVLSVTGKKVFTQRVDKTE